MAVDRHAFIQAVVFGQALPSQGYIPKPIGWAYDDTPRPYSQYNPVAAKEELAKAAIRHGRMADVAATSAAIVTISMPDFWLGYVLVLLFSLQLGWFPAYGFTRPGVSLAGAVRSGFLPALAITIPMAGIFARMLRSTLLETLHRAYVTAGRAMGFSRGFVFVHYVLRNALIPYVTAIGLQTRYLLGGVVVIERVFGVAGIGSVMVDAAFARDTVVVQGCAVVFLVIVVAVNLVVDTLCSLLDPRRAA